VELFVTKRCSVFSVDFEFHLHLHLLIGKTIDDMQLLHYTDQLKTMIVERQRNISRVVTPTVQDQMSPAYNACSMEAGTGMFDRMKAHISKHVENVKTPMFSTASDLLITQLIVLQVHLQALCLLFSSHDKFAWTEIDLRQRLARYFSVEVIRNYSLSPDTVCFFQHYLGY